MRDAANDGVAQAARRARPECLRLIEQTIADETPLGGSESSTNMIVLDDVSPRYAWAVAAVQACDVTHRGGRPTRCDLQERTMSVRRKPPSDFLASLTTWFNRCLVSGSEPRAFRRANVRCAGSQTARPYI